MSGVKTIEESRRAFVAKLGDENYEFYAIARRTRTIERNSS